MKKKVTRRDFLKRSGAGSIAVTAITPSLVAEAKEQAAAASLDRHAVFAALGDALIPTDPGDPGYRSLEKYRITEEVMKQLPISDADLTAFAQGSAAFFAGRTFLQLTEAQRGQYLQLIIDGSRFTDQAQLRTLQRVYRLTRSRVLTVFYRNYPEDVIPRDKDGMPILKRGDRHQITNPNTEKVVTGWDIAGFKGPLTWEEEEQRRARFRKLHWRE
jgi:hypothetical protein